MFMPGLCSVLSHCPAAFYFSPVVELNLYQPGKVNETVLFPSEWNDLQLPELHLVAKSILSNITDPAQAAAALFLELLKMRCGKKVKNIQQRLDAEDAVINGMQALDFLYKQNNLTKQPYPLLNVPNRMIPCKPFRMDGPADEFNSITCGEFEDTEFYFNQFRQYPEAKWLASLAAILYRPKYVHYMQYDAKTASYNTYDSERMFHHFMKLKPWQLYSIFLWYAGCREQLPKIFPNCFTGSGQQIGDEVKEVDPMLFTKIIHAGAGVENGSRKDIRVMLLKEFFMDIELKNIANNELKAQYDNIK